MSKELEALEKIVKSLTYEYPITENSELDKAIKIIESALKRLNYIDENKIYCISENYLQDIKKIKALEIIRNKNVSIRGLKISKTLEEYNGCRVYEEELTQEEYDLLKEVLL